MKYFSIALFTLGLCLSGGFAQQADAAANFYCNPYCPAHDNASSGYKYTSHNCRCKRDTQNEKCIPSGICKEYNSSGSPTGGSTNCECEKKPQTSSDCAASVNDADNAVSGEYQF